MSNENSKCNVLEELAKLKEEKEIALIDYHFAKLIDEKQQPYAYSEEKQALAVILAALLSHYVREGNSCLKLSLEIAQLPPPFNRLLNNANFPPPMKWPALLQEHIAFSSSPNKVAPLYFQNNALYLHRYWQAERDIADYLLQAVQKQKNVVKNEALDRDILSRFTRDESPEFQIDWQLIAVATALNQYFSVISGGPGTGKTTTVAKLLTAMQLKQLQQNQNALNVALVAPTGKAASRMKESLEKELRLNILNQENSKKMIVLNGEECAFIENNMPKVASTIHRLIGIRPFSDQPTYHQGNPLEFDLIVVDEASMIDLFVMEKLLKAVKSDCHLVLLGDKDQLPPVEAGAFLSELGKFLKKDGFYSKDYAEYLQQITGYEKTAIKFASDFSSEIANCLCLLHRSRRFDEKSLIGQLARFTNAQQAEESWHLLQKEYLNNQTDEHSKGLMWYGYEKTNPVKLVVNHAVMLYEAYLKRVKARVKAPQEIEVSIIFDEFNKVRFLSALRVGALGAEFLNEEIARALKQKRLVNFKNETDRYIGKPILITQNAPHLHLYSGDIGIILPDENNRPRVYFNTMIDEKRLSISPNRLPSYETAYVMTVHKSQGSEFEHTLLVMPDSESAVLNKELVYTAITRAREKFTLFCNQKEWEQALSKRLERESGLGEMLK